MKHLLLFTALLLSQLSWSQIYTGPVPYPTTGYAVHGPYANMNIQTFNNPAYPASSCYLYTPNGATGTLPTIFFAHGFGGDDPSIHRELIRFLCSHGYALVFSPYPTSINILGNYEIIKAGFVKAARDFSSTIDTSRVGFMGYSFGGGASFGIGHDLLTENNWGTQSNFIATIAAWYAYNLSNQDITTFPSNTHMLSFILDKDDVCDQRISLELHRNTNVPDDQKDVIWVPESIVAGYTFVADHYTFVDTMPAIYDAMDKYVFHRLLGALTHYVFENDLSAKSTAFGNGSPDQVNMPSGMNDLQAGDALLPSQPSSFYLWSCDTFINPRAQYCEGSIPIQVIKYTSTNFEYEQKNGQHIVSSPRFIPGYTARVYDLCGRLVYQKEIQASREQLEIPETHTIMILQLGDQVWKVQPR